MCIRQNQPQNITIIRIESANLLSFTLQVLYLPLRHSKHIKFHPGHLDHLSCLRRVTIMTCIASYLVGSGPRMYPPFTAQMITHQLRPSLPSFHLLVTSNNLELCTRHRESLQIINGSGVLTQPCLMGSCSGSCLQALASLIIVAMLSHYHLTVARHSNCLDQSRSNKSVSHQLHLLHLDDPKRIYQGRNTRKLLGRVVVSFALVPCSFPVIRYQDEYLFASGYDERRSQVDAIRSI